MSLAAKLLSASGGGVDKLYVDDVFSAYTYTGNSTTGFLTTQTINNGINLSGKGGVVWIKERSGTNNHFIHNTIHGVATAYSSASTGGNQGGLLDSFGSTGFTIGIYDGGNGLGKNYVSWTFRKAPKFFDVVTYTGNGTNKVISHSLGVTPGMIIIKNTTSVSDWAVSHIASNDLKLNTTAAALGSKIYIPSTTSTTFTINGTQPEVGTSGASYVAYLFAHDSSADGIIQCGSFTTDGSGNAAVNHGWSAGVKFAAIKASSTTGDWEMYDTARTSAWSGSDARLRANLSNAEDSVSRLSASGTSVSFAGLTASATYVYLFIVAPT